MKIKSRFLTQDQKDLHYKLVDAIKEKGTKEWKKHGEYRTVDVYGDYKLHVDTYNYCITVYKDNKVHSYLGSNFGSFESDVDMVRFWYGHKHLFSPSKLN